MPASIKRFRPSAAAADIVAEIRANGVAVVEDVFAAEAMEALLGRVAPALDAQEPGGGEFFGRRKRSVGALFARGREFSEHLLLCDRILEVVDGILLPACPMAEGAVLPEPAGFFDAPDPAVGPNCHHYRINATVAMQVLEGGTNQTLHRDQWRYRPYMTRDPDGPELTVAIMVAATDFTADNGATRYVPGSNRWPEGRQPLEEEVVQAVMRKGSIAFWLGSVYHGLGINTTDTPRTGFLFSYGLDHLAQEENQFLSVPPEIAGSLPARAQQLLGYRMSPSINWVVGRDPDLILEPGAGSVIERADVDV